MGLFIGASILTVLELFDYAYEVRGAELGRATQGWGFPVHPTYLTSPRSLNTGCVDEGNARRRPRGAAQIRVWRSAWTTSKDT